MEDQTVRCAWVENKAGKMMSCGPREACTILNKVVREDFTGKTLFELKRKRVEKQIV